MTSPPQAPLIAVGAVVLDRTGRVLLIQRARPPLARAWTLPGGRVHAGESLEAAVVRELLEETALETRVICALGPVTLEREGFTFVIHEYLATPSQEPPATPRAGDDAAAARWVLPSELDPLGLLPDARAIVELGFAEACARGLIVRAI